MKRLICEVLTLALLCALWMPAALAEGEPLGEYSEAVDAEVGEALDAGDTGLTVEGVEPEAEPESAAEPEAALEPGQELADAPQEEPLAVEGDPAVAAPADEASEDELLAAGIHFNEQAVSIGLKETYTGLMVVPEPEGSALPTVTWRSDNEKVATVDGKGRITGVKKGSATIYARLPSGAEIACAVKVVKAPTKLTMKPKKLTLGSEGATAQLTYTVSKGSACSTVTWSSSNKNVAVVDANGVVTTVGKGSATIVAKAYNGKSCKCKLTVLAAPANIAFPLTQLSLAINGKYKPTPTVTYGKGKKADPGITYSLSPDSRDTGCVTLDPATGEMTGVRRGSAILVATTYNGKTATLPVTVASAPTGITLSQSAVGIGVKDVYSGLLPTLTKPAGENDCAVTVLWATSNQKVATVDANGIVTGVKKGSCTITAVTTNGLKASCKVTVFKAPKKVKLTPANGKLSVGEVNQYKVKFPKGCGGTLRFDTSDHSIATITDEGVVTALAQGTVTVTATTYNNKTCKVKLTVTGGNADVQVPTSEYDSITSTTSEYDPNMSDAEKLEYVIYKAQSQLGKPYIYGSGYRNVANPSGFDCSGLVYWSFKQINITMQDSAYRQGYKNTDKSGKIKIKKVTLGELKRGDVVCFNTVDDGANDLVDHTGIYLGNGKFIHASSSAKKVVISTLASGYYKRNFSWGRRVLG